MPQKPKGRILVVDDDEGIREALDRLFELEGYEAAGFADGPAALEAAKARPFDVAVVDIELPGMNGVELMGRLRSLNPMATVVVITGNARNDLIADILKKERCMYLTKPFETAEILAIAEKACGRGGMPPRKKL